VSVVFSFMILIMVMVFSYMYPKQFGWFIIMTLPLLGPNAFTIISSSFMPLTYFRFSFASMVGIIASRYYRPDHMFSLLLKKNVRMSFIFFFIIVISSLRDSPYNAIISDLPIYLIYVLFCLIFIQSKSDMYLLLKIFGWQAAICGGVIILEYFDILDIGALVRSTHSKYDYGEIIHRNRNLFRAGIHRVTGLDGNAVATSYRLAFLFPLALWYSLRKGILTKLPIILTVIGLILTMGRAAIGTVTLISIVVVFRSKYFSIRRLFQMLLIILISIGVLSVTFPRLFTIAETFVNVVAIRTFEGDFGGVQSKIDRVPRAIEYFQEKPFIGYGSPRYVYEIVMTADDIPTPFIYLLSGGIILATLFIYLFINMSWNIMHYSKARALGKDEKLMLYLMALAILSGFIPLFSGWDTRHFLGMFWLYFAITKVYDVPEHIRSNQIVTEK
jgi:hypothetical protein